MGDESQSAAFAAARTATLKSWRVVFNQADPQDVPACYEVFKL